MAVVANPKTDDRDIVEWVKNPQDRQTYLIASTGRGYKVYVDASYYSERSGGVAIKGKVARDLDNQILVFVTLADAIAWVAGGMLLVRHGEEIEIKGRK